MRMHDFIGRGASVNGLCETFLSGAPVHAALIAGPAGAGKQTLASLCAQSLYCEGGDKPCGVCPSCKRYLSGSHPDAYHLERKKSIGVEEIRSLIALLQRASYEGGYKTVEIPDAGSMTVAAQNSLLKTLEEPPPDTVFLLTAVSPTQMLPTIRSRCRIIRLPPMTDEQLQSILREKGIEGARCAQLAAMASGSIGQALKMNEDDTFWKRWERVQEAMESVHETSVIWDAMNMLKEDRGEAIRIMDLMEQCMRNALIRSFEDKNQPENQDSWAQLLTRADTRSLTGLLERLREMRRMLASNVSWQAVIERFLLVYAEESKQWQL